MKNRALVRVPSKLDASASTGEHCPQTGWWAKDTDAGTRIFLMEGSLMPSADGIPVAWQLVASHEPAGAASVCPER